MTLTSTFVDALRDGAHAVGASRSRPRSDANRHILRVDV
jgi:hypothetical protein